MEAEGCGAGRSIAAHLLPSAFALIYIGTPMYVVSLRKRKDVNALEAGLYRKILSLPNNISNNAILNIMTRIRLAGEAISSLANRTREESQRQHRLTTYYETRNDQPMEMSNE